MTELIRCTRCLLPETHETISFDKLESNLLKWVEQGLNGVVMPVSTAIATKSLWQLLPEELRMPAHRAVQIAGITLDSRQVKPGDLFVADVGGDRDGRQFIPQALSRHCAKRYRACQAL